MELLKILVVDPQESCRTALAKLLRADGHQVTSTGNWATARRLATEEQFDVLISELSLPQRDECIVMSQLSDRCGAFGILLTAFEEPLARGWRRSGFCDYLYKPISYGQIRLLLARRLAERSVSSHHAEFSEHRELCHS